MQIIDNNNYANFFNQIVQMIEDTRYNAFQSINRHNILLNYNIGKTIQGKLPTAKELSDRIFNIDNELQKTETE